MDDTTQRELNQRCEYEKRLAAGLTPEPLVERVDLESIAGTKNFQRISQIESLDQLTHTILRGKALTYHTPTKRLLWQAVGQEHIEPELLNYIDSMPEDAVFYDVGASNGIFATYAAATGKQVFCFEPEVANFALLNYNTYLNRQNFKSNMGNFNVALSDQTELGKLFIKKFEAGGHLKILDAPVQRGSENFEPEFVQSVLKYRLDDFIALTQIAPPNFLKIDVDGCELQVIHGMRDTLRNPALQSIFIELEETNSQSAECERLILEHGFKFVSKKRVQNYFGENNCIFTR